MSLLQQLRHALRPWHTRTPEERATLIVSFGAALFFSFAILALVAFVSEVYEYYIAA